VAADVRDGVIEYLADGEARALEQAERYRLVMLAALDQLHLAHRENARLKESNFALREELQRYVRSVMFPRGRAAA